MTTTKGSIDTSGAAATGIQPTLVVAIEQNFPAGKRIIEDSLAVKILPGSARFWVSITKIPILRNWLVNVTQKAIQGGWSAFLVRKRYIDEQLIEAINKKKINSIVNLGAGYDTRLFRLLIPQNIPAWEVDQAVNINAKRKGLQRAFGKSPDHVKLVPINFIEQEVADVLHEYGYSGVEKTFFIWEAVSQYLTESAVLKTFDFFAKAPSGSQLVFTYVLKDFVEGKNLYGQEKFFKRVVAKDQMWHFGFDTDEIPDFLKKYGWKLIEDISYSELEELYVKPTGRNLSTMEIERMVYAEKL